MARTSAETLVSIARLLPLQQTSAEMLDAYFAADAQLRIDILDVSKNQYVAECTSHRYLDQFAASRSAVERPN